MAKQSNVAISEKNTKQQILDAYNKILKEQQQQAMNPQKEQQEKQKQQVIEKASSDSTENIIQEVTDLKLNVNQSLNNLGEKLASQFSKLEDIRKAIKFEQEHLEELYKIKDTADTLSTLICTQDEMKHDFERKVQERRSELEKEGAEKRAFWKEEQDKLEKDFKERKQEIEKNRKREEEEYSYNLSHNRQKEEDEYNAKKIAKEKELKEREKVVLEKEEDYKQLQKLVDQFDSKLESTVKEAKKELENQLKQQHQYDIKLLEQEAQAERDLKDQRIVALESNIKAQDALIKQLTDKTNQASIQVQEIATRALDTSRSRIVSYPVNDSGSRDDKRESV